MDEMKVIESKKSVFAENEQGIAVMPVLWLRGRTMALLYQFTKALLKISSDRASLISETRVGSTVLKFIELL